MATYPDPHVPYAEVGCRGLTVTDDEFDVLVYTATELSTTAQSLTTIAKRDAWATLALANAVTALAVSVRDLAKAITPQENP